RTFDRGWRARRKQTQRARSGIVVGGLHSISGPDPSYGRVRKVLFGLEYLRSSRDGRLVDQRRHVFRPSSDLFRVRWNGKESGARRGERRLLSGWRRRRSRAKDHLPFKPSRARQENGRTLERNHHERSQYPYGHRWIREAV